MKMKNHFRLVCFLLCFILAFLSFPGFASSELRSNELLVEEKIYCNATIDEEFDGSSVLVIMDKSTGGINKQHSIRFFGNIEISEVADLTKITPKDVKYAEMSERANAVKPIDKAGQHEGIDYENEHEKMLEVNPETFRQILKIELPTDSKENVLEAIKHLEKIEGIKYAGPNYIEYPDATPNDPRFGDQWALQTNRMNAERAWSITTGVRTVRVGIMDTGIANHPDLNANLVAGWDFFNDNNITNDDPSGHGTHVAGIVGAVGNNGVGISGVCWNVSLVPLQVVSTTGGLDTASQIAAITYAINNNISVINYSGSGTAVNAARNQMIAYYPGLFICSSGNTTSNNDTTPRYPSDLSRTLTNVISVAASNANDARNASSNVGANSVNIFAPGTNILSTILGNAYGNMSGTSMAAPQVTGVAALIMSLRPDFKVEEVKNSILNSVDIKTGFATLCTTGGRLNAFKAIQMATEPQTFTADVNGDGRADVILSRNIGGKRAFTVYRGQTGGTFSESVTTTSTRKFIYGDPAFVGDVNGDGRADIIIHWSSGGKRQLLIYRGNSNGTFTEGVNLASTRNHDPAAKPCKFFVADVNGDGRDDFIVHWRDGNGRRSNLVYTGTSTGTFNDATTTFYTTNKYMENDPVFVGDINGDGRADMIVHWSSGGKRQLLIYRGTSGGSFNTGVNFSSARNHDPILWPCQFFVADVNGDGRDDFIVHWQDNNGKRCNLVYNGTTGGTFAEGVHAIYSTNNYVASDPAFVGDINGDGRSDVIVQWRSSADKRNLLVYRANSNTTYNAGVNFASARTQHPILYPSQVFVADVNNDGRDDFIVKWKNGTSVAFLTYLGTTGATFNEGLYTTPSNAIPYFNFN